MQRNDLSVWVMVAVLVGLIAGSGSDLQAAEHAAKTVGAPHVVKAIAVLAPTSGSRVHGVVVFTVEGQRLRIVADVEGFQPNTRHGFHIHEFGDCSAPDATSAGSHFNPTGMSHGAPSSAGHHAGDFGNLQADASGKAHLELVVDGATLDGGPGSILGRGVIVHAQEDDLKTQPTGNAGARAACGVIGVAKDGIKR